MEKVALDAKSRVQMNAGNPATLTYDGWNYYLHEVIGQFGPAFEDVAAGADRQAQMTLDQFWSTVFGTPGASATSTTATSKASAWLQSLLVAAGGAGVAAATGSIPELNAVIPAKWGWIIPVTSMVVQGFLAHRNLRFNPNGTASALPFSPPRR